MSRRQLLPVSLIFSCVFTLTQWEAVAQKGAAPFRPSAAQLAAVSGEYADPSDPDTPSSFYAKDGKLLVETERYVPVILEASSALEYSVPKYKDIVRLYPGCLGTYRRGDPDHG